MQAHTYLYLILPPSSGKQGEQNTCTDYTMPW